MRLAQILYENGLITYMRTDSLNLSPESVLSAKSWLKKNLGNEYATEAPRFFKTKSKLAQEAHEAIRPTNPWLTSEDIKVNDSKEAKLYELIWRRFMASQMPQAIFEQTTIDILAQDKNNVYYLKANGSMLKFDGFLKIWKTQYEEKNLPELKVNDQLQLKEVKPLQHFTEPPPRYDEASLIKVLEEYGIGRPSTYAPIISVIQNRNYVIKNEQRRFEPTDIGVLVNKILVEHFPEIVDIGFTAKMEDDLDEIAEGKMNWQKVINDFYKPFSKNLEKKFKEVEKIEIITETTNEICDKCGKAMVVKYGRFGKFLACSGFPECKNTKKLLTPEEKELGICPKCNIGQIIKRKTKKGRFFYGCSRYPDCDFASWKNPQIKNQNKDDIEE
jgi:DNA topoisomerase-1